MWANDPEMAKKWEKEEKMKKETKVRNLIRKMVREITQEGFAGAHPKSMRKKFDGKRRKQSEVLGYTLTGKDDIRTEIDDATVQETKKRDYKAEYKKYGSSTKAKKYRAELNAYNRKKGTYGNGDKKDASHKGGKIVGFEEQSKNRGRREKSRLKKESSIKLTDLISEKMSSSQAQTLLNQLGGNKFKAMVGAKDFGIGSDGLHFKIGRNAKSISHVVIDYNRGKDLYDMKFLRVRAGKIKVVKKIEDVYFDMLGDIFKRHTGMNVRL
jgi:hypothetical protein